VLYYKSVRLKVEHFFYKISKGLKMPNYNTESLSDLAHEAAIAAIPTPETKKEDESTPCATKDVNCNRRWIESLSDCA
jgi:hypothetical protein